MDTTMDQPQTSPGQDPQVEAKPIDPEREIDAKSTVIWLTASLLFVVVSMWILGAVFSFSLANTHYDKIDNAPANELTELRRKEIYWLQNPAATPEGAASSRACRPRAPPRECSGCPTSSRLRPRRRRRAAALAA